MVGMTAAQVLEAAKAQGVKGTFVKKFANGEELREYAIKDPEGKKRTDKIRAFPQYQVI